MTVETLGMFLIGQAKMWPNCEQESLQRKDLTASLLEDSDLKEICRNREQCDVVSSFVISSQFKG